MCDQSVHFSVHFSEAFCWNRETCGSNNKADKQIVR